VYTGKDVVSHDKWEETMRREIDQEKKKTTGAAGLSPSTATTSSGRKTVSRR